MPRTARVRDPRRGFAGDGSLAERGELLLHLGDVPVAAHAVGLHALVDLAEHEVLLRLAPGTRDARLRIDDQVADQTCPRQRRQGEERRRRVAARRPDDRRPRRSQRRQRIVVKLGRP